MAHAPRNRLLAPGVHRLSRSQVYAKRALWKRNKGKHPAVVKAHVSTVKKMLVGGTNNLGHRLVATKKASRWYPAEDVPRPLKHRKSPHPTKLRASITPGTVLILLAGRFRGKRVVFLKQLASGLLLVTGPYRVNGVPLRRVNQAYVIATSTKIDLSGVKTDDKFNDEFFKREKESKQKSEEAMFGENKEKPTLPESRVADQKVVDAPIIAAIAKNAHLRAYLHSSFSLSKGQFPHTMKF